MDVIENIKLACDKLGYSFELTQELARQNLVMVYRQIAKGKPGQLMRIGKLLKQAGYNDAETKELVEEIVKWGKENLSVTAKITADFERVYSDESIHSCMVKHPAVKAWKSDPRIRVIEVESEGVLIGRALVNIETRTYAKLYTRSITDRELVEGAIIELMGFNPDGDAFADVVIKPVEASIKVKNWNSPYDQDVLMLPALDGNLHYWSYNGDGTFSPCDGNDGAIYSRLWTGCPYYPDNAVFSGMGGVALSKFAVFGESVSTFESCNEDGNEIHIEVIRFNDMEKCQVLYAVVISDAGLPYEWAEFDYQEDAMKHVCLVSHDEDGNPLFADVE